jgi:predicted MFS family arabinose efflux permease
MGLLFSAAAAGQLIFLPVLALLAEEFGWQGAALAATLSIAAMIPVVAILLPESPAHIGLGAYGSAAVPRAPPREGNPFSIALSVLAKAARSGDFWLLTLSFAICGFSTNGLINTHLIAYCADRGISQVNGAWVLAALGVFSLIGSTASGWLCDRYNPRILLFWYYSLRGLSLVIVPFTTFDAVSLSLFAIFYGLDWVATGPPTVALTNEVFGRRDTPVIVSWIFAAHQIGGALAAFGAGAVRSATGDYFLAFVTSGIACLLASLLALRVTRAALVAAPAE